MIDTDERTFYIIRRQRPGGFFSNFFWALGEIIHAHNNDMIPVVDMQTTPTPYSELRPVNGTRNVWEYYFEPAGGYTLEMVMIQIPKPNIRYSIDRYGAYALKWYRERKPTSEYIAWQSPILKKYVRLKPEIQLAHKRNMERFAGGKALGVHYRGTDIHREFSIAPMDWWVDMTRRVSDIGRFDSIFLATDEQAAADAFRAAFGDRLIVNDSLREPEGSVTGVHLDTSAPMCQNGVRYRLGEEVLLDMLTLSECDSLICGYSNVAMAAIMFNDDKYRRIIMPHGPLK